MCAEQEGRFEHFREAFVKSLLPMGLLSIAKAMSEELEDLFSIFRDVGPKKEIYCATQRCGSLFEKIKEEHKLLYEVPKLVCEPLERIETEYRLPATKKKEKFREDLEEIGKAHKKDIKNNKPLEKDFERLRTCARGLKAEAQIACCASAYKEFLDNASKERCSI